MIQMTSKERKENNLIEALESYIQSIDDVSDIIYKLIDGNCRKTDVSYVMSKHKAKLKRLETNLKIF